MSLRYIIYLVLLLIVLAIGVVRYRKLTTPFKILTLLIGLTLMCESVKKIVAILFKNSMPIEHLSGIIECILFSLCYFYLLKRKPLKRFISILAVCLLTLYLFDVIIFEPLDQFPSIFLNISQLVYLIYALVLFREMLLFPSEKKLAEQSSFWFNINILFFSTSIFLTFALTSYFLAHKLDVYPLYTMSYVFNIIFYAFIGVAILIDTDQSLMHTDINEK